MTAKPALAAMPTGRVAAACTVAALAAALLAACGGGLDGPTTPGMSAIQKDKEEAALRRAHTVNADAMKTIQAESAARKQAAAAAAATPSR